MQEKLGPAAGVQAAPPPPPLPTPLTGLAAHPTPRVVQRPQAMLLLVLLLCRSAANNPPAFCSPPLLLRPVPLLPASGV